MKVCCRLQKVQSVPGLLSGIVGSSLDLISILLAKEWPTLIKCSLKAEAILSLSVICLPSCSINDTEVLLVVFPKTPFMVFHILDGLCWFSIICFA